MPLLASRRLPVPVVFALVVSLVVGSGVGTATAAPFAYITNTGDNTVTVIDTANDSFVTTIPVGVQPFGVAVNPARTRVYVVNTNLPFAGTVSVINTSTQTVQSTVTVGVFPVGVAVSPTGDRVYVGNSGDETISVIATSTDTVVDTIAGVADPQGLAVSPDGTRLYVANCNANTVTVINTTNNTIVTTIPVGLFSQAVAVTPDGTRVYATNADDNTVSVIDTSTNMVVGPPVPVGNSPYGVAVHPAGSFVYVANSGSDSVSVISAASNTVVATVTLPVGASPTGLAVNPAGTRVFVANSNLNNVSVIDATSNMLFDGPLPAGNFPAAFGDFIGPGATHLSVAAPASATAGSAFSFTVSALDQYGHVDTGYTGTVHFTSSDGQAILPADTTLTNGVGVFSATLETAGNQTLAATDTVTESINGTSNTIAVSPAAATHFFFIAPSSATAGAAFSFTVTALDQFNNTVTGYTGTVHFTSSDGQAVLPANSTLTAGTGTFNATLKTAGGQTLTATDTVTASITGTSNPIAVSAVAATHFSISAPASSTAGTAFSFTVTALDPFNNTDTSYAGTVHFTSSDGQATLPANSTLTNGVGTFNATLRSGGSQTLTATDTGTPSITGTSGVTTVSAAAATHLSVSAPASATAGTAFAFTVTALDQFNNTAAGYAGTVHFTSSDGQAILPANSTLTNGAGTFNTTLKTAGSQTLTATDTVTSSITGTSNTIAVSAAAATHFSISAPASATAGTAFSFTVTALDQFNNVATGYAGTVHFTSSDGQAILPANSTLTNGTGTFSATLKTGGSQTLTGIDTVTASITGTSNTIAVSSTGATHYSISAPASATAGTAFSFTVTALDQFNNVATGYAGTVHFTSSDAQAILPANSTLTNGTGTFSATLKTTGSQTLTGTDTVTASITGTSNTIAVSAAAATHFSVSAPSSVTAGTAFSFTVTALDQFNNTATGYAGTVHFTSSDGQAILPANSTLTNGAGTFNATLKTTGSQTLTGTDTVTASITGTSNAITVGTAVATHFSISAPASATPGTAFSITVTARDQFNNTATGYAGTVHFTSSDPQATLPADATLTNGVGTFSATLKTAGSQTLTGTDTVTASITGTSNTIAVSAATATHLSISAPTSATPNAAGVAGTPISFTVTALDQFNNVATGYTGTVHFTSSDPQATLPADSTLTNGTGTFSATLRTAGSQTITARDTVNGSITGTSNVIVVSPAAATHFSLTVPATAAPGTTFSFTVTARDQFNNVATGYAGTVHFTSSDTQATLPADTVLTNGVGTFEATLRTSGSQTLTATDTVNSAITGSATINASVAPIPTLSTWAFLLLAMLLAMLALRAIRRRPSF